MNNVILRFNHHDVLADGGITIQILVALHQEAAPCSEVTPSEVGRHHEDFLSLLHDSIVDRDALALRITEIDFSLLLFSAIDTAHALENLRNARLIYTESIHDGSCTHHKDTRIPEEALILDILCGSSQIRLLSELVNTIDFLVASRRSTQISLNIAITRLRTSWFHTQGNNTVCLAGKLQGRSNYSSEFITVHNNMISRRNHNVGIRILLLDTPTDVSDARSCISTAWFLQDVTLWNFRQLLVNQRCISLIRNYPNVLRSTHTLETIEGKLQK